MSMIKFMLTRVEHENVLLSRDQVALTIVIFGVYAFCGVTLMLLSLSLSANGRSVVNKCRKFWTYLLFC